VDIFGAGNLEKAGKKLSLKQPDFVLVEKEDFN